MSPHKPFANRHPVISCHGKSKADKKYLLPAFGRRHLYQDDMKFYRNDHPETGNKSISATKDNVDPKDNA